MAPHNRPSHQRSAIFEETAPSHPTPKSQSTTIASPDGRCSILFTSGSLEERTPSAAHSPSALDGPKRWQERSVKCGTNNANTNANVVVVVVVLHNLGSIPNNVLPIDIAIVSYTAPFGLLPWDAVPTGNNGVIALSLCACGQMSLSHLSYLAVAAKGLATPPTP